MSLARLRLPHAAQRVLHLDLADDLAAMALDLLQQLPLLRNGLLERGLEVWLCGSGIRPQQQAWAGGRSLQNDVRVSAGLMQNIAFLNPPGCDLEAGDRAGRQVP